MTGNIRGAGVGDPVGDGNVVVADTDVRSKVPPLGLLMMLIISACAGLAVGMMLYFTSTVSYLILISVAFAALLAGGLFGLGAWLGKVRHRLIVIAICVAASLLFYGTFRYMEYIAFRNTFREEILRVDPRASEEDIDLYIDETLSYETGSDKFIGFVRMTAKEGMDIIIENSYRAEFDPESRSEVLLGETATYIYWVVELLIVIVVPAMIAVTIINEPFCEAQNRWLHLKRQGYVYRDQTDRFMNALEAGDFAEAGSLMKKKGPWRGQRLVIQTGQCAEDSPSGLLRIYAQAGSERSHVMTTTITREQLNMLML